MPERLFVDTMLGALHSLSRKEFDRLTKGWLIAVSQDVRGIKGRGGHGLNAEERDALKVLLAAVKDSPVGAARETAQHALDTVQVRKSVPVPYRACEKVCLCHTVRVVVTVYDGVDVVTCFGCVQTALPMALEQEVAQDTELPTRSTVIEEAGLQASSAVSSPLPDRMLPKQQQTSAQRSAPETADDTLPLEPASSSRPAAEEEEEEEGPEERAKRLQLEQQRELEKQAYASLSQAPAMDPALLTTALEIKLAKEVKVLKKALGNTVGTMFTLESTTDGIEHKLQTAGKRLMKKTVIKWVSLLYYDPILFVLLFLSRPQ